MKTLSAVIFVTIVSLCGAYERGVRHVVDQIRDMSSIGSDMVGYAGGPHGFYLLYRYCYYNSTDDDLREMLRDSSPAVRVMGAKCILNSPWRKIDVREVEALVTDEAKMTVGPGGCVFYTMSVGQVVQAIKKDGSFLGSAELSETNRKTPAAVAEPPNTQ